MGPDASHADDLASEVDKAVLLEQAPAIGSERVSIGTDECVHRLQDDLMLDPLDELLDGHDERRLMADPAFAVDDSRRASQRPARCHVRGP